MVPSRHMDASVLDEARRGDLVALDALVKRYHDRVYRFGLRACRDSFDADDAVQEAFAKLARRPDVARHPGALSWLMTVVKNACLRLLRPFARARRHLGEQTEVLDDVPADDASPEAALERWQLVRAVHEAIAALEPLYREVIILRDLEGMSGEEVGRALGISLPAMKTRLHRARRLLQEQLAPRDRISGARPGFESTSEVPKH
jgi:RNA polymerase sigma-70 factor, ECF subfamily